MAGSPEECLPDLFRPGQWAAVGLEPRSHGQRDTAVGQRCEATTVGPGIFPWTAIELNGSFPGGSTVGRSCHVEVGMVTRIGVPCVGATVVVLHREVGQHCAAGRDAAPVETVVKQLGARRCSQASWR